METMEVDHVIPTSHSLLGPQLSMPEPSFQKSATQQQACISLPSGNPAQPVLSGLTIRRHPPPSRWAVLSFHFCLSSTKLRKEKSWQGGRRRGLMAGGKLCRCHGEKWCLGAAGGVSCEPTQQSSGRTMVWSLQQPKSRRR